MEHVNELHKEEKSVESTCSDLRVFISLCPCLFFYLFFFIFFLGGDSDIVYEFWSTMTFKSKRGMDSLDIFFTSLLIPYYIVVIHGDLFLFETSPFVEL